MAAAACTVADDHAHRDYDRRQLITEPHSDPVLARLRVWLSKGWPSGWEAIGAASPEPKVYYSQWDTLEEHESLLHQCW